jgi:hypothetical protein
MEIASNRLSSFSSAQFTSASNENKMSDDGRERALLGVGVWKSSQKWSVQRSAVRSIAWLGFIGLLSEQLVRYLCQHFRRAFGE